HFGNHYRSLVEHGLDLFDRFEREFFIVKREVEGDDVSRERSVSERDQASATDLSGCFQAFGHAVGECLIDVERNGDLCELRLNRLVLPGFLLENRFRYIRTRPAMKDCLTDFDAGNTESTEKRKGAWMKITRREFIKRSATSAMAVGLLPYLPASARARPSSELSSLAAIALDKARSLGAGYADIRINRVYTQAVTTREMRVLNVVNNENYGFGVRVLVDGAWGFAACPPVEKDEIARIASQAVEIARANKVLLDKPIILAPEPAHVDVWQTPITKDPFKISIQSKIDLLLEANRRAIAAQKEPYRLFCTSGMNF